MIRVKDLRKTYKETTAVDGISLDISKGEIFGLLGQNGAGKTTLIMMLSSLLEPTSGTAILNGADILKSPLLVKRSIGVLFQDPGLDEHLTGYENLELAAVLYDIPKTKRAERINEMIDFVGLMKWADVPVGRYSGGMKRRLEIARALIHKPKILLLDEPTLGLDPVARKTVWKHIQQLVEMTVVLTTNYIEEADALCDRIGILESGRLIAQGNPNDLKASIKVELGELATKTPDKLRNVLEDLSYVNSVKIDGSKLLFSIKQGKRKELLNTLADFDLESIEVRKATLNDVFFHYTGKSIQVPTNSISKRRGLGRRKKL